MALRTSHTGIQRDFIGDCRLAWCRPRYTHLGIGMVQAMVHTLAMKEVDCLAMKEVALGLAGYISPGFIAMGSCTLQWGS